MKVTIRDIAYDLPGPGVTNKALAEENPDWQMAQAETLSGVLKRHVAPENETALDLARRACERLFSAHPGLREQTDAVIFCTQSPDYIMPPNACVLHKELRLSEDTFCLDLNAACSGYIYGLAVVRGLMLSGMARNALLINADTYSRFTHKKDRATRILFSDAAAVSWIAPAEDARGVVDIQCSTGGKYYESCIIPAGGFRKPKSGETSLASVDASGNTRTAENLHMDGMAILGFVNSRVPKQIRSLLERNQRSLEDVDLFIFHQASKMALDCLTKLLGIPPERVFSNLRDVGNTVSASIPIAFKDARESGRLKPGQRVLLAGFGAGLSWGSALLEV